MTDADPEAIRESLRRLQDLFAEIAEGAQAQSRNRCPYRDSHDICTARFRCRNQHPAPQGAAQGQICSHDGRFDYRSAWETRPDAYETTRAKLRGIRADAAARRAGQSPADPE